MSMDKEYGKWEKTEHCPKCDYETDFWEITYNNDVCPNCGYADDHLTIRLVDKVRRKVYSYEIVEKDFYFFKWKMKKKTFVWEYKEDE